MAKRKGEPDPDGVIGYFSWERELWASLFMSRRKNDACKKVRG